MTWHTLKLVPLLLSGTILAGAVIDRLVDTGPLVCAIDPTCRTMTTGEMAFAKPIFGDTIPYEKIHIFNRPPAYNLHGASALAVAHRSNMYLSERMGPARYDFGPDDEHADDFVHELTHLWQYYARGISEKKEEQPYKFNLKDQPRFEDFNQEQQAEIVLEYFNRHRALTNLIAHAGQRENVDISFRDAKIKEYCADLRPYEEKVRQALPVNPVPVCPKP